MLRIRYVKTQNNENDFHKIKNSDLCEFVHRGRCCLDEVSQRQHILEDI